MSLLPVPIPRQQRYKSYIPLRDEHIYYLIELRAEGWSKQDIIRFFFEQFPDDLPDFNDVDIIDVGEYVYRKAISYTSKSQHQDQKWLDHFEAHKQKIRTEIDGSTRYVHKFNRLKRLGQDTDSAKNSKDRLALLEQIRKEVEGDTTTIKVEPIQPDVIRQLSRQQRQELKALILANPSVPPSELLKQIQSPVDE